MASVVWGDWLALLLILPGFVPVLVVVYVNSAENAPRQKYYDGYEQQCGVFIMQIQAQQEKQYDEWWDVQKEFPD